jgi:hypothetical protein
MRSRKAALIASAVASAAIIGVASAAADDASKPTIATRNQHVKTYAAELYPESKSPTMEYAAACLQGKGLMARYHSDTGLLELGPSLTLEVADACWTELLASRGDPLADASQFQTG